VYRFLQRVWRLVVDEETGALRVSDQPLDDDARRALHRTIGTVRDGMEALRFNVPIARLMELTDVLGRDPRREGVEPLLVMLAPLAPHIAEELWSRLGHDRSVLAEAFPVADPEWTRLEVLTIPVQVKGKLRATVEVPAGTVDLESAARAEPKVAAYLADGSWRAIVVPGRLVNFVPT
jgi:leucyl-tRNA synthetase